MNISDLILQLQQIQFEHGDLEVCVMEQHGYELDEAAIDLARRVPYGMPFVDGHEWAWEKDNPTEQFSERVVIIY